MCEGMLYTSNLQYQTYMTGTTMKYIFVMHVLFIPSIGVFVFLYG
jgi:hypothetical protein